MRYDDDHLENLHVPGWVFDVPITGMVCFIGYLIYVLLT